MNRINIKLYLVYLYDINMSCFFFPWCHTFRVWVAAGPFVTVGVFCSVMQPLIVAALSLHIVLAGVLKWQHLDTCPRGEWVGKSCPVTRLSPFSGSKATSETHRTRSGHCFTYLFTSDKLGRRRMVSGQYWSDLLCIPMPAQWCL